MLLLNSIASILYAKTKNATDFAIFVKLTLIANSSLKKTQEIENEIHLSKCTTPVDPKVRGFVGIMKFGCNPKPVARMASSKCCGFMRLNRDHSDGLFTFGFFVKVLALLADGNVCLFVRHILQAY